MRRIFSLLSFLMVPMIADAQNSPQSAFWQWFIAHSKELNRLEDARGPLLDSLAAALHSVSPELTFELGPSETGAPRQLVLSADGIRSAFPAVESLYRTAPRLSEWRFIKFRPRRAPLNNLTLGRDQFEPANARYLLVKDEPGKVGIVLFLEHYSSNRHDVFAKAGYLILDEALGEYDMETRVGSIDFLGADSRYFAQSHPLTELAQAFDQYFATAHP
jgi:hypothetical protein